MNILSKPNAAALGLLLAGFAGGLCLSSVGGATAAPGGAAGAIQSTPPATPGLGLAPAAGFGTADSNRTMIAVTGMDLTGSSVLYLIDTENRQLACYQASGGSSSMQSVKLIGARRIDLDLQLLGFNDESEYDYRTLQDKFAQTPASGPSTGQ
jgi:hypothetical protein